MSLSDGSRVPADLVVLGIGARVVGAFTVNGQREIMRYRRHIVGHAPFEDALAEATAS